MTQPLSKPEMLEQLRLGYVQAVARIELFTRNGLRLQSIKLHCDFKSGESYINTGDKMQFDSGTGKR